MQSCIYPSIVGPLHIAVSSKGLQRISFSPLSLHTTPLHSHPVLTQLDEYFAKTRKTFQLTFDLQGTEFQKSVWKALANIPYGETRSYGAIAKELGSPMASRAVGGANHNNPIPIIFPCHRVVGSKGALTGFAGGLSIKTQLLRHEGLRVLGAKVL